ncbi:MAG: phosphotransferase [Candidatus Niyogibacteria bacterium]|nr:phosphotransferase [Candidatus Niyogibacteria bacterium]
MAEKTEKIRFIALAKKEAKEVLQIITENYEEEFHSPVRIERFLEEIASSRVYCITFRNGWRAVLKQSFWYSGKGAIEAIEKAQEVSQALRLQGVPLPMAYLTLKGKYTAGYNGDQITLLEYIEGEYFTADDRQFIEAGRALAVFHREGEAFLRKYPIERAMIAEKIPVEKPYEESRVIYDKLRRDFLTEHQCSVPDVCAAVRDHIHIFDQTIKMLDGSGISNRKLSSGIVHNDFNVKNCFFKKDGAFSCFIDTDQLGVAPFVWDVGNTLLSFLSSISSTSRSNVNYEHSAELFLAAYHREHPLPLNEYLLIIAAAVRWNMMRILRSLRRHHYENDRLVNLLPKIKSRLIARIIQTPQIFSFLDENWLRKKIVI